MVEKIHPDKLNKKSHEKKEDKVVLLDNPKKKEKGYKKKEFVPKERTFSSLQENPDLESIRSWRKGKVAKNMGLLLDTGAIEIIIKKTPEKLEEFFKKTNRAILFNLLKENSELKTSEIRERLNWSVKRTEREIIILCDMGLAGRRGEYGKIFLIEQEKSKTQPIEKKTTEKEPTPQIAYVLKTSVGKTFSSLQENPDLESIRSWRKGKVAKNMEKLIEAGAIKIEIKKHPEKLGCSIPIPKNAGLSEVGNELTIYHPHSGKINIQPEELPANLINRNKRTKDACLDYDENTNEKIDKQILDSLRNNNYLDIKEIPKKMYGSHASKLIKNRIRMLRAGRQLEIVARFNNRKAAFFLRKPAPKVEKEKSPLAYS